MLSHYTVTIFNPENWIYSTLCNDDMHTNKKIKIAFTENIDACLWTLAMLPPKPVVFTKGQVKPQLLFLGPVL